MGQVSSTSAPGRPDAPLQGAAGERIRLLLTAQAQTDSALTGCTP